jgi:DNA invertase Pin-like site-specific DNA recombinase
LSPPIPPSFLEPPPLSGTLAHDRPRGVPEAAMPLWPPVPTDRDVRDRREDRAERDGGDQGEGNTRRRSRGSTETRPSGRATLAVGYARRSTDRQEQSIPDQQKVIQHYCDENGIRLLRWYIDDAISGTSSVNRPGFQKLLADAQTGHAEFGLIVVYDVKRFGRVDNDEAGYYRHLLKQAGVEVLYAAEGFAGGETDDLLRPVKQWQARQESKDLSKVTIRGLVSKAQGGSWMGGVPPHGYDLRYETDHPDPKLRTFLFTLRHMPDGTKQMLDRKGSLMRVLARGEGLNISKRDRATLVAGEPSRVAAIHRIFEMYVKEGRGFCAVADALNLAGTPTPRNKQWSHIYGGKEVEGVRGWRASTIRAILVNPMYAGDMVWNRRTDARFHMIVEGRAVERKHAHGARLVPNDKADWMVVRDTHQGLVSRAMFEAAQNAMAGRGNGGGDWRGGCIDDGNAAGGEGTGAPAKSGVVGGWNGARSRFLLSGLCHCGRCGGRYQGVTRTKGKRRTDGTRVRTYSYACGSYIAKGKAACSFNPVGQEVLETAVIEAVLKYYAKYRGAEGIKLLTAEVRAAQGIESEDLTTARKRLEGDRREVERKIAALLDNATPGTRDLVEERLGILRRERLLLESRSEELELLATRQAAVVDQVRDLARFVESMEFTLQHGTNVEKIAVLRRCVQALRIDIGEHHAVEMMVRDLSSNEVFQISLGNQQHQDRTLAEASTLT